MRSAPRLSQVVEVLDALYPPAWAEDWDAVGLVSGDPDAEVRRIHLAVDPTPAVAAEAVAAGADLLLVHHPLLFRPVQAVATTTPAGRVLEELIRGRCALFTAHTNADRARPGVNDALARTLGLSGLSPLAPLPADLDDPPSPLGPRGLGRVGDLAEPMTLAAFAEHVGAVLPGTAHGVRVAGPEDAVVRRVAVCGGSGGSLVAAAAAAGADVLVTADLGHHPASDARDSARGGARGGAPHLVDVAHWASEWPWLNGAAEHLTAALAVRDLEVVCEVSRLRTDPWTFHRPSGPAATASAPTAPAPAGPARTAPTRTAPTRATTSPEPRTR